jgi:hypothetical protein
MILLLYLREIQRLKKLNWNQEFFLPLMDGYEGTHIKFPKFYNFRIEFIKSCAQG